MAAVMQVATGREEGVAPTAGVRFGGVRVRKHPMTLGDNPGGTTKGPPITIDWEHMESEQFSTLDSFVAKYPSISRGKQQALRLSGKERREIVSSLHSEEDIAQAEEEIKEIRSRRQESASDEEEGSIKDMIRKKQPKRKKKKESRGLFSFGRRRRGAASS